MAEQHVIPNNSKWQVKKSGAERATKTFDRQKDAIDYAKKIAINQKTEVVIHGKNGKIRDKDSYGNDPCPTKDTKF